MTLTEAKPQDNTEPQKRPRLRLPHPHILAIVVVVASVVMAYAASQMVEDYRALGYGGAFLVSLFSSAAIVFPVPGLAVVFALGGILNPFLVGLFAGIGMALGELTGYLAGYSGEAVLHKIRFYDRVEYWMRRYGGIVIFIAAIIPNPFFDMVGAAAGAFDYPVWRFLLWCAGGKIAKSVIVALAGAWGLHYILDIWARALP